MNKRIVILPLASTLLCGCSYISKELENKMLQDSGIYETNTYKEYERLSQLEERTAPIKVTFGVNGKINVNYY